jgi:hypothetical protein
MKMKELVPELHDVLKLTTLHHDVSQWSEQEHETFKNYLPISTKTWMGITQHHLGFGIYPTEADTFYLCMADSLASSMTRIGEQGSIEYCLNKLWKGPEEERDVRLKETHEVIRLFKFLHNEPSWEEFVEKYGNLLRIRPEDYRQGLNLTSLYTHCRLTGQFYRIFKQSPNLLVFASEIEGKTQDEVKALYRSKFTEKWQLGVCRCKFHFFQKPWRVRDLNIFSALGELIDEICRRYYDNVLLATSNQLLMILSDETDLPEIASMAHEKGFWVEVVEAWRSLNELQPNPSSMVGNRSNNLYELPSEISPPICELCQSAKATKYWPDDYVIGNLGLCSQCSELLSENTLASVVDLICEADKVKLEDIIQEPIREELCEKCFTIRVGDIKLQKLDIWSKIRQNKVAWIKLNLDINQLEEALRSLSRSEVSFSVVCEFQEDYSRFLRAFTRQSEEIFGVGNVETIAIDFLCAKVETFRSAFDALKGHYELMKRFFPAFLELQDSPIKLTVVCAGTRFPFFEVWRAIEEAQEDVLVSIERVRTLRAPIKTLEILVRAAGKRYSKSALHKLMRIEESSQRLAELALEGRHESSDRATYSGLARTLRPGLDFSSIFTFAQLMED